MEECLAVQGPHEILVSILVYELGFSVGCFEHPLICSESVRLTAYRNYSDQITSIAHRVVDGPRVSEIRTARDCAVKSSRSS